MSPVFSQRFYWKDCLNLGTAALDQSCNMCPLPLQHHFLEMKQPLGAAIYCHWGKLTTTDGLPMHTTISDQENGAGEKC